MTRRKLGTNRHIAALRRQAARLARTAPTAALRAKHRRLADFLAVRK